MPPSIRKLIDSWYPGYRGTLGTRAFTLIELLITISILAILGSAISIVLNPAELLAEARDSQRINDLESLRNSLSLTLIDNPSLFDSLSNTSIYLSLPSSSCLTNPPSGYTYICNATSLNLQKTDSTGWLPLSLTNLPIFPIDPINSSSSSLYYAFVPDLTNKTFVLTSLLESEKYLKLSALKDGGTDPGRIEEGNPTLWTSASGLVGYWPMDEGSGSVVSDLSGSGNAGVITGAPLWSDGKLGDSLFFNQGKINGAPSYDYVNIASDNMVYTASEFTMLVWSKANNTIATNEDSIVGMPDSWATVGQGGFWIHAGAGGYMVFRVRTSDIGETGASYTFGSEINNWHFYAGVFQKPSVKFYVDSIKRGEATWNNDVPYKNRYRLGYYCCSDRFFDGYIDEVRIYNRALTESEIKAIYASQR